jgi:3'-phosphoadenosine 5'-phosphosulfate sulfotransferase (PAPS reductase)/FAD synthetase
LVAEWRAAGNTGQMRILNCLGIRAQESPARAKKPEFGQDSATNGKRQVDRWLPVFGWSEVQVWSTIRRSGVRYHEAYDLGMPRLSCVFCVLAGRRELTLAAKHNPELAAEYVAVEKRIGHTFKADLSMEQIATDAGVL